jgi:Protein of unknown function (DUF3052)
MAAAAYSGMPLLKKLGIEKGDRVVLVFFTTERADLEQRIEALGQSVFPDGSCWIAWPKRSSKLETDITEDVVREMALPLGLVDNKVCAIDETWSGLRLVWRKERRI